MAVSSFHIRAMVRIAVIAAAVLLLGGGTLLYRAHQNNGADDNDDDSQTPTTATETKMVDQRQVPGAGAPDARPNLKRRMQVEIWGKASVGHYLWAHILGGSVEQRMGGIWSYGKIFTPRIAFTYRTGPGVRPDKVPKNAPLAIMVLNAHSEEKIPAAREWLDHIPRLPQLRAVGIVLHAQEGCTNDWVDEYLRDPQYKIKFVFVIYPTMKLLEFPKVRVQQWPLGVATYRGFPPDVPAARAVGSAVTPAARKYLCNFQATVYPGSTREEALAVLRSSGYADDCFINVRTEWVEQETNASLYRDVLLDSDYTIAPAGRNTECYRFYESFASGSTPIIEDLWPPGCDADPLALLRDENAPAIYITSWSELPAILKKAKEMSAEDLQAQRRRVVNWYDDFKLRMQDRFHKMVLREFTPFDEIAGR